MKKHLIAGLIALGWTEQQSRSKRYRMFTHPSFSFCYLVGKSGALRRCELDAPISSSVSLTDSPRRTAICWIGQHADQWETCSHARAVYDIIIAKGIPK